MSTKTTSHNHSANAAESGGAKTQTNQSSLTLRQWLQSQPFALGLSAGFFGFFAHCGVLTALEDERLVPARVSGASAGALVAGMWAACMMQPTTNNRPRPLCAAIHVWRARSSGAD